MNDRTPQEMTLHARAAEKHRGGRLATMLLDLLTASGDGLRSLEHLMALTRSSRATVYRIAAQLRDAGWPVEQENGIFWLRFKAVPRNPPA